MAKSQANDPVEELKQAFRSDEAVVVRLILDRHPELRPQLFEKLKEFRTARRGFAKRKNMRFSRFRTHFPHPRVAESGVSRANRIRWSQRLGRWGRFESPSS